MPERKIKKKLIKKLEKKLVKKVMPKLLETLLQRRRRLLKEQEPERYAAAKRYAQSDAETMMRDKLLKEAEIGKEKAVSAREKREAAIETLRDEYPELSERDLRKRVKNELGFEIPEFIKEPVITVEKQREREILAKEKLDKLNKQAKVQQREAAKLKYEGDAREYERKRKEYEATLDKRTKIEEQLQERRDRAVELTERIRLAREQEAADIRAREEKKAKTATDYSSALSAHQKAILAEENRVKKTLKDIKAKENRIKGIEELKAYQNAGRPTKESNKKAKELLAEREALIDNVEELKKQAVIAPAGPKPERPRLEITKKIEPESQKLEQDLKHVNDLAKVLEAEKSQLPNDPLNTRPTLQFDVDEDENLNRVREEAARADEDEARTGMFGEREQNYLENLNPEQRAEHERVLRETMPSRQRGRADSPLFEAYPQPNAYYNQASRPASPQDELDERITQPGAAATAVGLGLARKYCIHPNHIKEGKHSMLLTKEGKEHVTKLIKIMPKNKVDYIINWSLMNHARNKALGLKKLKKGESNLKGGGLFSWLF